MCFVRSAEPEAIQQPASIADPQVQQARADSNRKQRASAGAQSTILSSLMRPPQTLGKQLLGQ